MHINRQDDGINRNIVECKGFLVMAFMLNIHTSINRNIVECKGINYRKIWFWKEVLIETLWNVKFDNYRCVCILNHVLIETLWNVKPVQAVYAQTIAAPY